MLTNIYVLFSNSMSDGDDSQDIPSNDSVEDEEEEDLSSVYDFVELCAPGPSQPSSHLPPPDSGNRRIAIELDEEDDAREVEEDESAGQVIGMDEAVRLKWVEGRRSNRREVDIRQGASHNIELAR